MPTPLEFSKKKLDILIQKQRVDMYKPIQIAEILYHARTQKDLTLEDLKSNLESYRNISKKWRDNITLRLVGHFSTSSQKYQDNLFEANAIPPDVLYILADENQKYKGVVERYIYQQFRERQKRILRLAKLLDNASTSNFKLQSFLNEFITDKGIRRSIDKAYEIVVYALFDTLVKHLRVQITLSTDNSKIQLLQEFEEFAKAVLGIDSKTPRLIIGAKVYRAGATNAADRGLDMWANFGPVVQVKHLSLSEDLAEDISDSVDADRIVIVCKDAERMTYERVLKQLGQRVQAIIVESQLVQWYEKALRGKYSSELGNDLLNCLKQEFKNEFPYSDSFEDFYKEREYDKVPKSNSIFWQAD